MAAVITKGYTLTDGLLLNYNFTTLHGLVDAATVTNIGIGEFATSAHLVQISATVPSSDQGDGSLWYDTTLGVLRTKNDNSRWDCAYVGPEMTNPSGTIRRGEWVVANGDGTIAACATGMWPECLGVAANTAVSGAKVLIISKGLGEAMVIGPCTIGNVLITAGHAVFAFGNGNARTYFSTGITSAALGIEVGVVFAQVASGVTALATCMIWR